MTFSVSRVSQHDRESTGRGGFVKGFGSFLLSRTVGDPMEGWPDESFHPGDAEDEDESLGRDLKMVKALSRSLEFNYNTTAAVTTKVNTKAYLEEVRSPAFIIVKSLPYLGDIAEFSHPLPYLLITSAGQEPPGPRSCCLLSHG